MKATLLSLGFALLATATLLAPTSASAEDSCEAAQKQVQDWVNAHAGNLPTELKDLRHLPMAYRKAVVAELSPVQKASLWREHLSQYAASHPDLSKPQVAALKSALALLTPELFTQEEHPSLALIGAQIRDAFGAEEAIAIVATLGPVEAPADAPPALAPLCQCSRVSQYCGSNTCRAYSCTMQTSGCGAFYQFRCDGLCG
ncbi:MULTISPECIES: bacteriocin fulvocin C-related protein [Myxococcus]|uniref:bacteriocin fulvocin C-related protein n=1 Tax=Myxococcus TaxID=32 RepID=UPI001F3CBCCB|nr:MULTISPECIES: bacteriocin fulvocin C-related protein [Myxococcus]WAM25167.1 bacteriocin fulvocin C-related protein [Myxococcus sp. NMCA1]